MTKKRGKRSVPSSNPLNNKRLYTKSPSEEYRGIIFGLILCLAGGYFLFATQVNSKMPSETNILIAGLLFLGILSILSTLFGTVQSITLDDENLIFSYRARNKTYKAAEVIAITQSTSIDMGSSTGIFLDFLSTYRNFSNYPEPFRSHANQQYGHYATLFITLRNGKKIEIPGFSNTQINVKRLLLDWQTRYSPHQD